jgi:hypothetical protein
MALRDSRALYFALLSSASAILIAASARAETPAESPSTEVGAARALFFDALREEQAHQLDDALRDFLRVRAVRDTPAVEYRIGSCEEGLGHRAAAFAAFEAAVSLAGNEPRDADVAEAARRKLDGLAPRLARVTVVTSAGGRGAPVPVLALDGQVLAPASLGLPLVVDPGPHVITATYDGRPALRMEVVLARGESAAWTVPAPTETSSPASSSENAKSERESASRASLRYGAIIGWAAGAVLVAGGGVLLWLRSDDIATLNRTCPDGHCPANADRGALEETRSHALAEGPWAAVLGGTGIVAAGVGTAFAFAASGSSSPHSSAEVVPTVGPTGAGLLVRGVFR